MLMIVVALCICGPAFGGVAPDRYIVQLAPDLPAADIDQTAVAAERRFGGVVGRTYRRAIRGFSITLPQKTPMKVLYNLPGVILVEPDVELYRTAQTIPTGVRRINAHRSPVANINGIDQRVDVGVAVIDTGIQPDHPDLNVGGGKRFCTNLNAPPPKRNVTDDYYQDDNGHGTHVAGTIGALDNGFGVVGVAPGVRLWAIRVFNDLDISYVTDSVAALEWVIDNADEIQVVNMSIGSNASVSALRTAVQNAVAAGVVIFAAAGNDAEDVYGADGVFGNSDDFIPAAYPEVAAVSALRDSDGQPGGLSGSSDDTFWTGSNRSYSVVAGNPVNSPGGAIDLMMPGYNIYSTHINSGYVNKTGTSMASPHAAGLAALYIAAHGRATNAAEVYAIRQALIDSASEQTSPRGLKTQNDPDGNPERIGYIIPADFNLDGRVDEIDLLDIASAWLAAGTDAAFCPRCDIHLPPDGVINLRDLAEFAAYWLVGYD